MKPRRTSLKDLADHLGVSIATVSRALRNSHEVGEEMTRKVKELAKQLNYRHHSLRKPSQGSAKGHWSYCSQLGNPLLCSCA